MSSRTEAELNAADVLLSMDKGTLSKSLSCTELSRGLDAARNLADDLTKSVPNATAFSQLYAKGNAGAVKRSHSSNSSNSTNSCTSKDNRSRKSSSCNYDDDFDEDQDDDQNGGKPNVNIIKKTVA